VLPRVAKVVSGKSWNHLPVRRDEIRTDSHPGWHVILGELFLAGVQEKQCVDESLRIVRTVAGDELGEPLSSLCGVDFLFFSISCR